MVERPGRPPTSDAARMEPCVPLDAREAWQAKDVPAVRLHPELPSRAVVARLTDSTPIELPPPLPGLPPARDQQQLALRLAETGRKRWNGSKEALEPRQPSAETKLRTKDPTKAWARETTSRLTFTMCERQN